MRDIFTQRKQSILSRMDKSSMKRWDKKIIPLCNKINKSKNYCTTSSCSGRVVLMIDQEKKSPNLFLALSHDLISFKWIKENIDKIMNQANNLESNISRSSSSEIYANKASNFKVEKSISMITGFNRGKSWHKPDLKQRKNFPMEIKFKCEPIILHVICRDLNSAVSLLEKAKKSGLKHSGIHSIGKKIILEINGSDKLEFPIINKSRILVSDNFLKIIIKKSNEKLKKNWNQIKKLEKSLK